LPTCSNQIGVPSGLRPKETQLVSIRSVTPVVTGATGVFHSDPAIRFQQAVDVDLEISDLERGVLRLARQLAPAPQRPTSSGRRSRRSAWWPTA